MTISRKCVPFTPFDRELSKSTIAIVTAGGVHLKDQEPFNIADELGDLTYREILPDVDSSQLMVTHHHYDHRDADEDINVVFPIDVLRDLETEGFIGGIAKKHIGYMGYTMQLKAMYEGTVCHRTVVAVQREIEMKGIPTVLITVSPEVSAQMRPPRALYPKGFKVGNSLGRPGMRELQKKVLRDALELLTGEPRPGSIITIEYPEYGEQYEPPRVRKL